MNNLLTRETINLVMGPRRDELKRKMDDYLNAHGISDSKNKNRQIEGCIGENNALLMARRSDGLSISFRNQAFVFEGYNIQNPTSDSFNIKTSDLTYIFGLENGGVKSLLVSLCESNTIIVEFSLKTCRGGGAGGDGVKVRLPTPPVL